MAYTKQTWTTGDTVTASKMNHIEDGIENAGGGGGGVTFFEITTTNYPNSNNIVGYFCIAKNTGGTYTQMGFTGSINTAEFVYGNGTFADFTPLPVPGLDDYVLAFLAGSGTTITSASGGFDMSTTSIAGAGINWHIISGPFTITLNGWD